VTGDVSLMYQIKSTLSTFLLVSNLMPQRTIREEYPRFIERVKELLSAVPNYISNPELQLLYDSLNKGELGQIKKILQQKINDATIAELKRVGYFPIPQAYLPDVRAYI